MKVPAMLVVEDHEMDNDTLAICKRNGARTFWSRNPLPIFESVSHPVQPTCKQ